jgi:hypothetical protein
VILASPVRRVRSAQQAQQAPKDLLDPGVPRGLLEILLNGEAASCVDGPQLARVIFVKSTGRLQSCVRPFGAVAHDRWP